MDYRKAHDRVNRKALCQVLKMYDVGGKLLNGTKSTYVKSNLCQSERGLRSVSGPIGV